MSEVPGIEAMESLWALMLDEIAQGAKISTFESDIVKPSGDHYASSVTRIGTFNIVSDGIYLNYLPENDQLVEFARQPGGSINASAVDIAQAQPGDSVAFAIDPSRGTLLGMLVQAPNLIERVKQGKEVGYAIIAVLIIGLIVVVRRLIVLSSVKRGMEKQLADMDHVQDNNPLGRALGAYYENKHLSVDVVTRKLDEVIVKDVAEIKKGLPFVKVLAAVAPLMGLLGTVTGMIGTFQAITLFGTGDPKLMAGGISQALVTTVLGLVAAIPLLLSHSLLNSRAQTLIKVLAEQAAGMVATQAEFLEKQKRAQ
ncbi:MAG: MotA/TolQ/ExbB proton channel family protein, partial [Pseudomonadota bacterium]